MTELPSPFPASPQSELGILSSFMHAPERVYALCVAAGVEPSWFSEEDRSTAFSLFMDMSKEGIPIDLISASQAVLDRKIHFNTPTPDAFLAEVLGFTVSACNVAEYISIVKRQAARKLAILACQETERKLREDCASLEEVHTALTGAFTGVSEILVEEEAEDDRDKVEAMRLLDDMEKATKGERNSLVMPFGLPTIDEMTGGGMRGELVVITGLPSVGKSLLGQRIVSQSVFQRSEQAHVYSLEMGHQQCLRRYIADIGSISLQSMRKGIFTKQEFNGFSGAIAKVTGSGLRIYDLKRNRMTPESIEAEVRRGKKNRGVDVVMADYLQLIRTNSKSERRRDQDLQDISKRFKLLAQELDIMFVLLAQANEAGGCFDSSQVEADADWVLNLNPIFKNEGKIRRIIGTDAVYLSKAREGERGKKIPLKMEGKFARIFEIPKEVVSAADF